MVSLGGLGYKFAAWEAAGSIQDASWGYLEAPGRQGSGLGGHQILRPRPGGGRNLDPWGQEETIQEGSNPNCCRLQDYKHPIYKALRLQGWKHPIYKALKGYEAINYEDLKDSRLEA